MRLFVLLFLFIATTLRADDAIRRDVVDAATRWAFSVTSSDVMIESDIIRLGDIVRPLQPGMAAWPRLSRVTIGLLPVDGSAARISRDRLAGVIASTEATPAKITLHGPETIHVSRRQATVNQVEPVAEETFVADETSRRIKRWVEIGLQTNHKEIVAAFDFDVQLDSTVVADLESLQGITSMEFIDNEPIWSHTLSPDQNITSRVHIVGRGGLNGPCKGTVAVTFRPRPGVIVARRSLGRGSIVSASDLDYEPTLRNQPDLVDIVTDPSEIIGQEVSGTIRAGVPLSRNDFSPPRVIRRGDLLEVRVTGGGVRVTTGAKSMSDGARGDMIEIETLQPKRRLLARVVDASVVEIVTRPTQVTSR